jgi:hypothetical protein
MAMITALPSLIDVCDGEVCLDAEKGTRKREVRSTSPPQRRSGGDSSYIVSTQVGGYPSLLRVDLCVSAFSSIIVVEFTPPPRTVREDGQSQLHLSLSFICSPCTRYVRPPPAFLLMSYVVCKPRRHHLGKAQESPRLSVSRRLSHRACVSL